MTNRQRLTATPFAPLTQEYVTCRESVYNAVISSVGVTSGNLSLLFPVIIFAILLVIGSYQQCSGQRWPKGYHQSDKSDLLDRFATLLLLLRDGKLESSGNMQMAAMAKELQLLSNQLVKQYEPLVPVEQAAAASESMDLEDQQVEMHYGQYASVPSVAVVAEE